MNFTLVNESRGYVELACIAITILLALYLILAVPAAFLGKREKRRIRLKRVARNCIAVAITTIGAWFLADYAWKAAARQNPYACHSEERAFSTAYRVIRCGISGGYDNLRVYSIRTKRLVADRTYTCIGDNKVIISVDQGEEVVFDACAYEETLIKLPPSLVDQLRAMLP
ncbi:hypothetical protein [Burkholderia pyrrocinia]|uniref:hypothetical protein n=1 Tax=Burkholderia pyrrocinia TaxID=60550 RepID=UPI00158D1DA2|nr:hypothetical protein [Burkholderia pyrrocinia]